MTQSHLSLQQQPGIYKRDSMIKKITEMKLQQSLSEGTILNILMDPQGIGYSKSYAYELMREARKEIAEVYSEWTFNAIELAIADLEEQREQAKRDKSLKPIEKRNLVRGLTRDINEIKGLYVVKHEVKLFHEQPLFPETRVIDITPEQKKLD